jgi:hypothetical protein
MASKQNPTKADGGGEIIYKCKRVWVNNVSLMMGQAAAAATIS